MPSDGRASERVHSYCGNAGGRRRTGSSTQGFLARGAVAAGCGFPTTRSDVQGKTPEQVHQIPLYLLHGRANARHGRGRGHGSRGAAWGSAVRHVIKRPHQGGGACSQATTVGTKGPSVRPSQGIDCAWSRCSSKSRRKMAAVRCHGHCAGQDDARRNPTRRCTECARSRAEILHWPAQQGGPETYFGTF
ncbi:unnamed protein product [Ectocarpus sp. 13 AM-2016]